MGATARKPIRWWLVILFGLLLAVGARSLGLDLPNETGLRAMIANEVGP